MNEYERAKKDFLSGRIKGCRAFFENNRYYTQAAYCCLILDEINKALELFKLDKGSDIRADWGCFLVQLLKADINSYPTYFQIRNFLEIDINIFILYCKENYIEKIIRYADFMAYYNPECYKFIGRVFWANNLMPAAMFFLNRAKDKFYHDPELHYLLAYIYFYNNRDYSKCKKALTTCLELLPKYAPAAALLKKLEQTKT